MTIPSALFIDRYQLSDRLFLESQNLVALNSLIGEQDLEAPDWVVQRWGSLALLQVGIPESSSSKAHSHENWTITIPMHLRYDHDPTEHNGASNFATVELPWPNVFWACTANVETKLSNNPFDRTDLGYDELFTKNTIFYHIFPESGAAELVMNVQIPILDQHSGPLVQVGTLLTVIVGFAWICYQLLATGQTTSQMATVDRNRK